MCSKNYRIIPINKIENSWSERENQKWIIYISINFYSQKKNKTYTDEYLI